MQVAKAEGGCHQLRLAKEATSQPNAAQISMNNQTFWNPQGQSPEPAAPYASLPPESPTHQRLAGALMPTWPRPSSSGSTARRCQGLRFTSEPPLRVKRGGRIHGSIVVPQCSGIRRGLYCGRRALLAWAGTCLVHASVYVCFSCAANSPYRQGTGCGCKAEFLFFPGGTARLLRSILPNQLFISFAVQCPFSKICS